MKILSYIDTSGAKDATTARSPVKVCMHVRGVARTDVRVMREGTALVQEGFSVSIVDFEYELTRPVEEDICGIHLKHIIKPHWFTSTRFKPWLFVKAAHKVIYSTLQLLRIPADIYHAHDVSALPACYIAARLRRKPLIFDAHELPFSEQNPVHRDRFSGLRTRLLAHMMPHCAGVITVSPHIAQEIRNRYHHPAVTLVRNTPPYRIVSKSDRLRQHLGLSPGVRIALYQGNLQPDRGLDRLIRAAAFLEQDIVIVLMGRGIGATQSQLEDLIASEGVANCVRILPPVPYEELLDWTSSADIGLSTAPPDYSLSIRMSLPNKLFEYLMAGLPVLASSLDAVVDILRTYDVGRVVSSPAPADLGGAINAMLADRVALTRLRRNALDAAQHDLCWGKEQQQLIHLYQNILAVRNA